MLDDVLSLTWKMANIMQLRGRLLENSATWKILRPHLFKSFSSWGHKQTTLTHTWTTVVSLLYVIIPPTKVHDIIVVCSLDWFKWACMKFASCEMAAWHCGVFFRDLLHPLCGFMFACQCAYLILVGCFFLRCSSVCLAARQNMTRDKNAARQSKMYLPWLTRPRVQSWHRSEAWWSWKGWNCA